MAEPTWLAGPEPAARAGARLADALADVVAARGRVRLAIPGGSALAALEVARARPSTAEVWARTHLTWVDERCVPEASADSNRGAAARGGLLGPPAPAASLPLFLTGEDPAAAVARVARSLAARFGDALDVVLLGLGEDGHVASLFPGALPEGDGLVAHVPHSPKPPPERITLTRAALATAHHTILLATGEAKRDALVRLRAGDPALPAVGLPHLTVVTDLALENEAPR